MAGESKTTGPDLHTEGLPIEALSTAPAPSIPIEYPNGPLGRMKYRSLTPNPNASIATTTSSAVGLWYGDLRQLHDLALCVYLYERPNHVDRSCP